MVIILLFGMINLVFFKSREQQLIHAHTERFRISLNLLTLLGGHIQLQRFVIRDVFSLNIFNYICSTEQYPDKLSAGIDYPIH